MNVTLAAFVSALAVVAACGSDPAATTAPAAATSATPSSTVEPRPGVPAVPGDDRRTIPRVDGDDTTPPAFTTMTTLLADDRPALVVTLPEAVLFPFGSADLRQEADLALRSVVDLFRQHPGAMAEVSGHTDSVGPADYNRTLSQRRAGAVTDWLVDNGVARAQLRPVGFGATRPLAGNATEEDRRRNRRVEITIRAA